jgi:hypothetical protein
MRGRDSLSLALLFLSLTAGVARADVPRRADPATPDTAPPTGTSPATPPDAPATPPPTEPVPTLDVTPPDATPPETSYIAPPIPDDEAVIVSFTTPTPFTSPMLTLTDHTGAELDCVLPCTVRTRAGHLTLQAERLSAAVDLDPAGLTYDVTLSQGPSGDDIAIATALALSGGLVLGLSIWAFVTPDLDDSIMAFAVIGAIYGGIAFLIGVPFTFASLAMLSGSASMTGFRVGLTSRIEPTANGLRLRF